MKSLASIFFFRNIHIKDYCGIWTHAAWGGGMHGELYWHPDYLQWFTIPLMKEFKSLSLAGHPKILLTWCLIWFFDRWIPLDCRAFCILACLHWPSKRFFITSMDSGVALAASCWNTNSLMTWFSCFTKKSVSRVLPETLT